MMFKLDNSTSEAHESLYEFPSRFLKARDQTFSQAGIDILHRRKVC